MFSLLLHADPERLDLLIAELHELGTAGIVEEEGGVRAFFEKDSEGEFLGARFAEFSPTFRAENGTNWVLFTQESWPPMEVGQRFFVVAPWHADVPTPQGKLRLETLPGMRCGTGRHPATQLCLTALERSIKPGARVLDVGSGSGILTDAAKLLGAGVVIGCDIDPEAAPMFVGSADAVRPGWADVVVANIDAATIERIAPELQRVRAAGSVMILSGFQKWDLPEGFANAEALELEEWACLIC